MQQRSNSNIKLTKARWIIYLQKDRNDVIGRSEGRKDRNCFDIQKGKNDAMKCTVHVSKIKLSEGLPQNLIIFPAHYREP